MSVPTVTREGGRLVLETPFELKDAVKRLPTRRWDKKRRRWHVAATQETAAEVRRGLGDMHCDQGALELFAQAVRADEARPLRFADDLPPIPGVEPNPLNPEGGGWIQQRRGYWFALEQEGSALIIGMGGGKSLVAVKLYEAWGADLVVELCPSKARKVWPREFHKWGERDWIVDNGSFRKRDGTLRKSVPLKQRVERMRENLERGRAEGRPVCLVVNYEAAWQGAMRDFLLGLDIDVLGMDEVHKLKSPGGKWSRFGDQLRSRATRRLGKTGTFIPHSEPDVYGECRAIDPGVFGTNFGTFQRRYFEMGGYEGREVEGFLSDAAEREFNERWQRIAYICEENELELPGVSDMPPVTTTFGAEAQKAYKEISGDFITWVKGGGDEEEPVTAANALARILRLQQVTSGHLPVGEDGIVDLGREKEKLLLDELDDIPADEPVVVYARFVEDLRRIERVAEKTGRRYAEISGRRDDGLVENPDDPSADGTMNPDCDLVGVQIQAGAEGIDLTRSCIGLFYSLILDLGLYLQVRKRQDRPGQTRPVRFGFLEIEGSVDEVIRTALEHREDAVGACIRTAQELGRLEAGEEEVVSA